MSGTGGVFRRVPVGPGAGAWLTVDVRRRVLVVVHNVTALNRLLDVLPVLDNNHDVQLVATVPEREPFAVGLAGELTGRGLVTVSWEQALYTTFDLIISASHHAGVADLHGPKIIMAHGAGYNKYGPGTRDQGPGTRDQGPGTRDQGPGTREAFGLSAPWLLQDGRPSAEAFVLSHTEQRDRVARDVPSALPNTVICGDPCLDRMLASTGRRDRYRAALGVRDHQTLIVVTSTWSRDSLLGTHPDLPRRLTAQLPHDRYRLALITHPNIVAAHGAFQLRSWFADCLAAGLILIPPAAGWQATVIAADQVIGDHGSVTTYAAALGRPTVLGAFPRDAVVPGTAAGILGDVLPRLCPDRPPRPQLDRHRTAWDPRRSRPVRDLVSSVPGEAAARLRELIHTLMELPEPAEPAVPSPLPDPVPGDTTDGTRRPAALWAHHRVERSTRTVSLSRYPADVRPTSTTALTGSHLVVHTDHPHRGTRESADVLIDDARPPTPTTGLLADHPGALVVALVDGARCLCRTRDGVLVEGTVDEHGPDPAVFASAVHAWLTEGYALSDLSPSMTVDLDGHRVHAAVWVSDPGC